MKYLGVVVRDKEDDDDCFRIRGNDNKGDMEDGRVGDASVPDRFSGRFAQGFKWSILS
jgi:hypothetical protein